jgi:serine/threonine protein kinase
MELRGKGHEENGITEEWLRGEMLGLAQAVDSIHNLRSGQAGYIKDIKPENIIVFKSRNNELQLTDWGCAGVKSLPAGSSSSHKSINGGDLVYYPPESEIDSERTSRPHDIWSLGCVFFELMVWYCEGDQRMVRVQTCPSVFISILMRNCNTWRAPLSR